MGQNGSRGQAAAAAAAGVTPISASVAPITTTAAGAQYAAVQRQPTPETLPRAAGAPLAAPLAPASVPERAPSSDEGSSEALPTKGAKKTSSFATLRGTLRSKREAKSRRGLLQSGGGDGDAMQRRLNELFDRYRATPEEADDVEELELSGDSDAAMGPAGLAAFLADLGCGEDDLIGIVVAWKLGARRLGRVTRTEFVQGLTALNCDSIAAIKAILPRLEAQLKDRSVARDLFSYAWQVAKAPSSKTLDLPSARVLLELLLPPSVYPHTGPFAEWITQHQTSYRAISKDQWDNFFDFATTINADASNFDDDEGWPYLLDEYVEWRRHGQAPADGAMM